MALLESIATGLQIPGSKIRAIARKADHAYYRFRVPKRAGGFREINHPARPLKAIQRWLLYNLVSSWEVHPAAYAYIEGRGIKDHAILHVQSKFLLRLDIRNFFPSITDEDLRTYLETSPPGSKDWQEEDHRLFGQLVCRQRCLTIGAPTSPALSNVICADLDRTLSQLADALGLTYSRYADDLFFSTSERDVLAEVEDRVDQILTELPCPGDVELNPQKTRHSSKRGRRQVTGLVLSPDETVRVGRHRKRFIRRQIHRIAELSDAERRELAGLLAFAMDVEPEIINSLTLKYGPEAVRRAREGQ
jgi:RNA-directed DNA polymerase